MNRINGERGIRTPGGKSSSTVFKTVAIIHSAISPNKKINYIEISIVFLKRSFMFSLFLIKKSFPLKIITSDGL